MSNKSWSGFKVVAFRNGHEIARADSEDTLREALEDFRKHVNVAIDQGWDYAQTTIWVEYMPDLTSDPDAYRLHWEYTFGDGEMSGPGTMSKVFDDVCRYFKRVLQKDKCMTAKFRKKPVIVEAMQFTEDSKDRVLTWITCTAEPIVDSDGKPCLLIGTLEGDMKASIGDWIIKGVKGEFYPCKPCVFEASYEATDSEELCANEQFQDEIELVRKAGA
jgi:enamine deaminase RidA (YjgF/YER057c/UK114 family)